MPRGFRWCVYETDDGRLFGLRVDADLLAQGDRGWSTIGVELTNPFPRGWLPRRVRGIDGEGNIRYTRIGRLTSPLWTGAQGTFVFQGSDLVAKVATVVGWQGEWIPPVIPSGRDGDAVARSERGRRAG